MSVFTSLTTCWKCPNKLEQTLDALHSLPIAIQPVFIVNEYPEPENFEAIRKVFVREFPQHILVQKTEAETGQAASLNIIIRKLKESGKKYWLHLEESWYLDPQLLFTGKFDIENLIKIMDTSPLAQLQLTAHWRDLPQNVYLDTDKDYARQNDLLIVPPPKPLDDLIEEGNQMDIQAKEYGCLGAIWPQFSLLPGLTRADTVIDLEFPEDKALWPVKFEYLFSIKWAKGIKRRNIYKATFRDITYFIRKPGHVSTYDQ